MNEEQVRARARRLTSVSDLHFPIDLERIAREMNAEIRYTPDLSQAVSGCVCPPDDICLKKYLIIINANRLPGQQRFTVAHELWHIIARDCFEVTFSGMLNRSGEIAWKERCADIFAAELLMPESRIRDCYASGLRDVALFCEHFGVSRSAMEIRLFRELGYRGEDFNPVAESCI